MKKIITILLLCFSTLVSAQNLQFSRVIDTILTVNTGAQYVSIFPKYIGESMSPPAGKVWKINNVQIERLNTYGSNSASNYGNSYWNDVYVSLDLNDGNNSFILGGAEQYYNSSQFYNSVTANLAFPLWINSSSNLTAILTTHGANNNMTVTNFIGKIYISLIEFNTQ